MKSYIIILLLYTGFFFSEHPTGDNIKTNTPANSKMAPAIRVLDKMA